MCVGRVLGTGLWRCGTVHIVREKAMSGTGMEFFQGFLRLTPRRLIGNTQADAEKSQFGDGTGIEFVCRINPILGGKIIGMRRPTLRQNQVHIE